MRTFLNGYPHCIYSNLDAQHLSNAPMDTLALRLKAARERTGWTQAELARRAGMRQAEISKLEGGSIARSTRLAVLAHALQCNPYWLSTGEGEPWATGLTAASERPTSADGTNRVPVRGSSYFKPLPGGIEIDTNDPATSGVVLAVAAPGSYAIRVRGDANAPAIKDGQFVVVEKSPVRVGDLGIFHFEDGEAMLFELLRETDESYYVDSAIWGSRETLDKRDVAYTEAVVAVVSPSRWVNLNN